MNILEGKEKQIQKLQILFNEIQICDNKKFIENLRTCISLLSQNYSLDVLLSMIYPILLCKKSKIPTKIVLFLKRLFDEIVLEEEGKLSVLKLFDHLISLVNSKTTRVRKNIIFLLNILSGFNFINEKISTEILIKISERLFDKEKSVRKETILFLCRYQNFDLNESTKIISLFKNIIRYDPSNECRKIAFENLEINLFTHNCIIERCSDINLGIRNIFYKKMLEKINIREIRSDKKMYLLKKAFTEREINSTEIFVNCCLLYYDLPTEFTALIDDLYSPSTFKLLEKLIKQLLNFLDFNLDPIKVFEDSSLSNLLFYFFYLSHIEDTKSKDELNLLELSKYVEILYNFIKNAQEDVEKKEKCKIMFKILNFYDFFDDESRKIINSTIYKSIKNGAEDDILEEAIKIVYKIDPQSGDKMFGALIHKHIDTFPIFALKISKYIFKYSVVVNKIHEAIMNEIVLPYQEQNLEKDQLIAELLFFYQLIESNDDIFELFKSYRKKCKFFFEMSVDLSLKLKCDKYRLFAQEIFFEKINTNDASVFIPGSKLILSQQILDESLILKYVIFALSFYFTEEDDHIQQYLNVFFHEYFLEDSSYLIDAFCPVLENLDKSEKYFIDRVLYLIENSKKQNGTQILFYKICVNLYTIYADTKLGKKFLYVLSKINIVGAWNTNLTKKILFCCTQLIKKPSVVKKITDITSSIMTIDDGEPISQEDLQCVKQDLCIFKK